MALNQSGFAFELGDAQAFLADTATSAHAFAGRRATVTLLPMDSAGDTSLRLIDFCIQHTLHTVPTSPASARSDGDRRSPPVSIEAMVATLADQLPIGVMSLHGGSDLHLDYTLAVDSLGAIPTDIVVDVVQLLDDLFTSALRRLQALVEAETSGSVSEPSAASKEAV